MYRTVRDILSLVTFPALLLVLVMWGRSYFVMDRLTFRGYDGLDYKVRSDVGHVTYFATTSLYPNARIPTELHATDLPSAPWLGHVWESFRFLHEDGEMGLTRDGRVVTRSLTMVPYWVLALVMGAAPGLRYWEYRKRRMAGARVTVEAGDSPALVTA